VRRGEKMPVSPPRSGHHRAVAVRARRCRFSSECLAGDDDSEVAHRVPTQKYSHHLTPAKTTKRRRTRRRKTRRDYHGVTHITNGHMVGL
jgi:hypothetical protein